MREKLQSWFQYNRRATIHRGILIGLAAGHPQCTNPFATQCMGQFKLSKITNMDQIPLAFEFLDKRTYEVKGEKTVWLKETRSRWDRQASSNASTLCACEQRDEV